MSTRSRTNGLSTSKPQNPKASSATSKPTKLHSPYLPTPTEILVFALYPVVLLLGSLFSLLSPSTRPPATSSIYSHAHQSFQPAGDAPSYFATKRNVFNVYFVKVGWFWCTIALTVFTLLASRGRAAIDIGIAPLFLNSGASGSNSKSAEKDSNVSTRGSASSQDMRPIGSVRLHDMSADDRREEEDRRLRRRYQVLIRWALTTLIWFLVTQWFFGGSLIDRLYSLTGGGCYFPPETLPKTSSGTQSLQMHGARTQKACKKAGGRWGGGFDISGHVFLLILGSGMLAFEVLPIIFPWARTLTGKRVVTNRDDGSTMQLAQSDESPPLHTLLYAKPESSSPSSIYSVLSSADSCFDSPPSRSARRSAKLSSTSANTSSPSTSSGRILHAPYTTSKLKAYSTSLALLVVLLSWWMLLMTAAFFHTWLEKTSASLLAGLSLWLVYVAPRGLGWWSAIGVPGV